jgi:threonine/homoserine/homoserine lactone efflux protein
MTPGARGGLRWATNPCHRACGCSFGALITNLLNPKAAVFYVTVMPAFVFKGRSLIWQTTWLVLIYALAATMVHAAIVLASGTLEPLFRRPDLRRRAGVVSALALVAVAVWLLMKTAG